MGDEPLEEPMHLNVRFKNEEELKELQDFLYRKSQEGVTFTGLLEAMSHEVTIVTAIHNIKSNQGSKTAGVDEVKMDKYLQMPHGKVLELIKSSFAHYRPKPARRIYIEKANGKKRPLGIPTIQDRIIQECMRLILEPICEAKFYPHSYGFRPYRATKHAVREVINIINASAKSKTPPVYVVEGDIKGCFDNINHRILLGKVWKMGIHDKRVLSIIKQMLAIGYVEEGLQHSTEVGTGQGSILSPLLANVYLNDFDWYLGRQYYEPVQQCKYIDNDRRRLKSSGVTPKYNIRYADDWVVMTTTMKEAERLKRELGSYFAYRLKLELSEEKTRITDMTTEPIHFLGFCVKAEQPRTTPEGKRENLVGKPLPDMQRVTEKIRKVSEEIRKIHSLTVNKDNIRVAQITLVNSMIMGLAEYWKVGICSPAFKAIDRRINLSAFAVWKRIYPDKYNQMQIPLEKLHNLPHRHEGYKTTTFAIQMEGMWIGITKAFITHSQREKKPYDQLMSPYTQVGRKIYANYRTSQKSQPMDRPSINTPTAILMSVYNQSIYNFEYMMNREYAFNRDRGMCRCCKKPLSTYVPNSMHCHHVNPSLPLNMINKVPNLAWLCPACHRMVHGTLTIPGDMDKKIEKKILKLQEKLEKKSACKA
jgi:group II intron reverse transcriptase/maturase